MTIIDRKNHFIYLKSHKTAGTSTEVYLITQTELGRDIYRTSTDIEKYGFPRKRKDSEFACLGGALPDSSRSVKDWVSAARFRFGSKMRIREHMAGDNLRELVGQEFFDQCLLVTSIRNPWDALVSSYKWQQGGRGAHSQPVGWSFSDFLRQSLSIGDNGISIAEEYLFHPYVSGKSWVVDRVIVFEDLSRSIDRVVGEYGMHNIGFSNASIYEKRTRQKEDYRVWYTDADARAVEERFSSFLSRFHYDFNAPGEVPNINTYQGTRR